MSVAAPPLHKDAAVVALATDALRAMAESSRSLLRATLLTDDGFEVAGVPAGAADGRLASMASSVQALTEGVAHELAIAPSQYVIVAAEGGHVIQVRVPGQDLVLAALFGPDEALVNALASFRVAAERLVVGLGPLVQLHAPR